MILYYFKRCCLTEGEIHYLLCGIELEPGELLLSLSVVAVCFSFHFCHWCVVIQCWSVLENFIYVTVCVVRGAWGLFSSFCVLNANRLEKCLHVADSSTGSTVSVSHCVPNQPHGTEQE